MGLYKPTPPTGAKYPRPRVVELWLNVYDYTESSRSAASRCSMALKISNSTMSQAFSVPTPPISAGQPFTRVCEPAKGRRPQAMTRIYENPAAPAAGEARTRALVIGAGRYPYAKTKGFQTELNDLSSVGPSVRKFVTKLLTEWREDLAAPLATVDLLLSETAAPDGSTWSAIGVEGEPQGDTPLDSPAQPYRMSSQPSLNVCRTRRYMIIFCSCAAGTDFLEIPFLFRPFGFRAFSEKPLDQCHRFRRFQAGPLSRGAAQPVVIFRLLQRHCPGNFEHAQQDRRSAHSSGCRGDQHQRKRKARYRSLACRPRRLEKRPSGYPAIPRDFAKRLSKRSMAVLLC